MESIVVYALSVSVICFIVQRYYAALKLLDCHIEQINEDVKYTPETIKQIFVKYWTDRWDNSPVEEKGACLVQASKTDDMLDKIFTIERPVTEEQLVERGVNVVPMHPPE